MKVKRNLEVVFLYYNIKETLIPIKDRKTVHGLKGIKSWSITHGPHER